MIVDTLLAKVIGTQNQRDLKRLRPIVAAVNAREPEIEPLTEEQPRGTTVEFRHRLAAGAPLGDPPPQAFAGGPRAGARRAPAEPRSRPGAMRGGARTLHRAPG